MLLFLPQYFVIAVDVSKKTTVGVYITFYFNLLMVDLLQGSKITIKSHTWRTWAEASYLLPKYFPNNLSYTRSYLNRMKDC